MIANRVLTMDDQPEIGRFVSRLARIAGYTSEAVTTAEEFRNRFEAWQPTHVVLDLMVPDVDGIEIFRFLAAQPRKAKIIILSGIEQRILKAAGRLAEAQGLQIIAILGKPVRAAELRAVLDDAKAITEWLTDEDLVRGIESQEFFLNFQPKIRLPSRELVGFEALLRWQHPERGLVPPLEFIPFAEQSLHIDRLTLMVIEMALRQLHAWQVRGFETSVAVNVSGRNLQKFEFVDRVLALCRESAIPSARLTFELTETAVARDAADSLEMLSRFRANGVGLSIDDFGTAYSSLVQLQRMPFSEIKIDRTFVADCLTKESAAVIVRTIIALAKNLGIQSVAEGVESEAVLAALQGWGCDVAQGYWISRPLLPAAVPDWVERWQPSIAMA